MGLIGKKFGYLKVIKLNNKHSRGNSWVCRCDCGNEVVLNESHLIGTKGRNPNKSCGCKSKRQKGDSLKYNRLYTIYTGMLSRCYDSRTGSYNCYGESGIKVCDSWRSDFQVFKKWALNNGYDDELSLDRMNAMRDYEPDNCRWVSNEVQAITRGLSRRNTTGVKGVCPIGEKYRAYISINGKRKFLGVFENLEEATKARKEAEEKYHKPLIEKYTK